MLLLLLMRTNYLLQNLIQQNLALHRIKRVKLNEIIDRAHEISISKNNLGKEDIFKCNFLIDNYI